MLIEGGKRIFAMIFHCLLNSQVKEGEAKEEVKQSAHVQRTLEERKKTAKIDPLLESQFQAGRLYACISSRPGQSGRADGYILEGKELEVCQIHALMLGIIH